uniref:tachylectin-related carbohydrate-binding protein n=1 Tax=Maridesulfovibrio zosterae TaxID=82171 RepID=UPI0005570072
YSATYVPQTTTTENLNTVASADAKKVFASGNNGASIYGKEVYWTETSSIPGTGSPKALVSGDGKYIGVFKNTSDELSHFNAYVTTDKGASWKVASGDITEPIDEGKFVKKDGKDYFVSKIAPGILQVVKIDTDKHDSTGVKYSLTGSSYDSYTIFGGSIYAFYTSSSTYFLDKYIPDSPNSNYRVDSIENGKISACGATAKAFYVLTTDNKIMVMVDGDNHLTAELSGTFVEVQAFKALLSSLSDDSLSLYSATDGKLILIDEVAATIYIIDDSNVKAEDDVSTDGSGYISSTITIPGNNISSPKFSGPSSHLAYSYDTDVYMYSGGAWSKYEGNEKTPSHMASSGSGIMVSNSGASFPYYSTGPKFSNVLASTLSSPENTFFSLYNASKTDVYVGSSEGSYHGAVKADTGSVVWDSERVGNGIIGTYRSYVFGSGDEVYAVYAAEVGESTTYEIARKNSDSWEKLELTGDNKPECRMAIAAGDGVIYYAASNGLDRAVISGSTYSFTDQTASTDGDEMPTSLGLIAASPSGDVLYGVSGNSLYKFSDNSDNAWKVETIKVQDGEEEVSLNCVMCLSSDKVYIVGDKGYAALYDGKTVTPFEKPASENLNSCWAYADKLYAAGNEGKVYEYDLESKKWSSSIIASGS